MLCRKPLVEYSDGQYQYKVPFIMYVDFESILEPISGPTPNPRMSSTHGVNVHTPSGWCVRSEFAYREVTDPLKLRRRKDCVSKFCEHITGEARRLYSTVFLLFFLLAGDVLKEGKSYSGAPPCPPSHNSISSKMLHKVYTGWI